MTDGDTITVLDAAKGQHKIRLEGIDAPESKQAFGTKAKQALSDRVLQIGVARGLVLSGSRQTQPPLAGSLGRF